MCNASVDSYADFTAPFCRLKKREGEGKRESKEEIMFYSCYLYIYKMNFYKHSHTTFRTFRFVVKLRKRTSPSLHFWMCETLQSVLGKAKPSTRRKRKSSYLPLQVPVCQSVDPVSSQRVSIREKKPIFFSSF